jgi:hypothetical protein
MKSIIIINPLLIIIPYLANSKNYFNSLNSFITHIQMKKTMFGLQAIYFIINSLNFFINSKLNLIPLNFNLPKKYLEHSILKSTNLNYSFLVIKTINQVINFIIFYLIFHPHRIRNYQKMNVSILVSNFKWIYHRHQIFIFLLHFLL